MIETVFALILVLKGEVVEHTYKDKLSSCMKSARIAKKEVNPANVRFICKQVKAETEIYMGAKKILRIITEWKIKRITWSSSNWITKES